MKKEDWTSISDSVPEKEVGVLVWIPDGEYFTKGYYGGKYGTEDDGFYIQDAPWRGLVSHWSYVSPPEDKC